MYNKQNITRNINYLQRRLRLAKIIDTIVSMLKWSVLANGVLQLKYTTVHFPGNNIRGCTN